MRKRKGVRLTQIPFLLNKVLVRIRQFVPEDVTVVQECRPDRAAGALHSTANSSRAAELTTSHEVVLCLHKVVGIVLTSNANPLEFTVRIL